MDPNNGESCKRKRKEPIGASKTPTDPNPVRYYPMHEQKQPHLSSSHVSTELCLEVTSSNNTQSNNANTNGAEEPDYLPALGNQLRRVIAEEQRRQQFLLKQEADEIAAKRLRERGAELVKENEALRKRVSELEEKVDELADEYLDVIIKQVEEEEEVGESGRVDADKVELLLRACVTCALRRAAMMLLPCHHVCVCSACEPATGRCPECGAVKNGSIAQGIYIQDDSGNDMV